MSYDPGELQKLILLLVKVSLDPAVCGTLVQSHLSQCIGALLQAVPLQGWPHAVEQMCASLEGISHHHHNQLYIAQVITTFSERQEQLVRLYVKRCIVRATGVDMLPGEIGTGVGMLPGEIGFVRSVLQGYYRMRTSQHDFYLMFSVLKMLNLYLPLSKMKWNSLEDKQDFTRLLSWFASQLRDRVSLNLEITVVKDYIMDIKMELDSHHVSDGPRQQTLPFSS